MARRPATTAALAVVLVVVGQLLALAHEAQTRHITCAAHGELVEAANVGIGEDDGCGQAHLLAVDGDDSASHQDCAIARLLRTSVRASEGLIVLPATTAIADVRQSAPFAGARAVDVILIAPKTSPPV